MPNSQSGSKIFNDDALDSSYHFRWASIRNLIYITFAYSSHPANFDLFNEVTLLNYTAAALIIGMTYMSVDIFIRQYTRHLDSEQNLSPVLKNLTFPLIMQSTIFALLYIRYVGDGVRFLTISLSGKLPWSTCPENFTKSQCLDTEAVLQRCDRQIMRERVPLNITSVHIHYTRLYSNLDRALVTWRLFATAVTWILNFCLASISDSIAIKFYKYVLYLKVSCGFMILTFLAISTGQGKEAFIHLMQAHGNGSISVEKLRKEQSYRAADIITAIPDIGMVYGVGRIGVYDFGSTSPYTMIDNAVLLFTVCFIFLAFMRSMIATILLLGVTQCIDFGNIARDNKTWHYVLFVLLPYGTEFLYGQKLIIIYLYMHLILTLIPFLMLYTIMASRLIHGVFPSIKLTYIAGLLCIVGFCLSTPIVLIEEYMGRVKAGIFMGFTASYLYLGSMKMAIIMWVYGVRKFCTDVNFWLGFSPTKFWVVSWSVLPALLLGAFGYNMYEMSLEKDTVIFSSGFGWFIASALITFILQLRTIIHYVSKNNLSGAFRSNKKYGPPDASDRRRRRRYDPTVAHRVCFHGCISLDEEVDCNHMPLMNKKEKGLENDSESSLMQMYKATATRTPSVTTVVEIKSSKEKIV